MKLIWTVATVLLVSCEPTPTATCSGCVSQEGCVPLRMSAGNDLSCGVDGQTCMVCGSGQRCSNGVCGQGQARSGDELLGAWTLAGTVQPLPIDQDHLSITFSQASMLVTRLSPSSYSFGLSTCSLLFNQGASADTFEAVPNTSCTFPSDYVITRMGHTGTCSCPSTVRLTEARATLSNGVMTLTGSGFGNETGAMTFSYTAAR